MTTEAAPRRKRKRRPPPAPCNWSVRYAVGAYLAVIVAGLVFGVLIFLVMGHSALRLGIGGLTLDAAMLACLVPLYRRRRFAPRDLGLRAAPPARSVGLVVAAVILIAIVNTLWLTTLLHLKAADSLGIPIHGDVPAVVLAGLFLAFTAPVTEEIFFRGLLYRALRNRMNVAAAAIVAGIMFGAIHALNYPLDTLPPRVAFGIVACLLYEGTGSLLPGIALHCLIDAGGYEVALTGHNRIVFPAFLALGAVLLLYAGARGLRYGLAHPSTVRSMHHSERRSLTPRF